jgi:DNA-3-methyladenine glycosylase
VPVTRRLGRAAFARPATTVGPDLLGCTLVRRSEGIAAVIIEVEAYDEAEPAAHTFRGPTPGNAVMWGPAGHLYTYFTYGMHWCANVVTGAEGQGQAVLLRAAELVQGEEAVRRRRGDLAAARDLLRGPARLAQAFGLGRDDGGRDLVTDPDLLVLPRSRPAPVVAQGPRVGVRLAADLPWRFWVADHPLVSAYRRHPRAERGGQAG